jgi:DNA-binding MurR/RpiR family transcriptional regulator
VYNPAAPLQQNAHQEASVSIQDLIAGVGDRLTPTERRIAGAILEDPTLVAFGTVSALASRVETSRPSIVRFATKLGFDGYADLQAWVRNDVARQLSTPAQRIRRQPGELARIQAEIEQSIHRTLKTLDAARVRRLAAPLVGARRIWVLSGETSRAGAIVLHSGLSMVRDEVHLVETHDLGRDLSAAAPGDAAVVFDFARYRRNTVLAAKAIVDLGVDLVAVTDGPLSPLASMTETWCELHIPAVGPFDSALPSVLVAELLVIEVVAHLGAEARDRIDRLERLWTATRTFWGDSA